MGLIIKMAECDPIEIVDGGRLSRLLYVNPVCVLSVAGEESHRFNFMMITWLTCINNKVSVCRFTV